MSKHILRFRLGGGDLSYANNKLTTTRFQILFEGNVLHNITGSIVTITSNNKFTARVVVKNDEKETDFGISFESQLEDTYGDNYSMDISDVSVLGFSLGLISLNSDVTGLTLKLYKASITNNGIKLGGSGVDNTVIELDSCTANNTNEGESYVYICIGGSGDENISNSTVIIKNCYISSDDFIHIGIGINANSGEVSNSMSSISDSIMEYKGSGCAFIDLKYINNITLSLDNVIVINKQSNQ